jgi:hypothetical protein
MSTYPPPPSTSSVMSLRTRSMGGKFFIILLLAFLMSISGFFVENLTVERASVHGLVAASAIDAPEQPKTVFGMRLADSYRSTRRSVHYITLFLGLVFLTYFLFEVLTGKSVHPAQYALVGIAQTVFYLLLLALAEHLGFDLSFLIASAFTVALLSINTDWVFRSRKLALRALAVFTLLYSFIYVLLRVEAYALLVGAAASFAAVAAAMYITRNVDWYGNAFLATGPVANPSQGDTFDSWLK